MAALTKRRPMRIVRAAQMSLPGKTEQVYQGGIACFDTSTGLVAKAFVSTTLVPIGTYAEDKNNPASGEVLVNLFREFVGCWMVNSGTDAVDANDMGKNVFLADDQTVAETDGTGTLSVAGRAYKLDSVKGVLVEFANPTGA